MPKWEVSMTFSETETVTVEAATALDAIAAAKRQSKMIRDPNCPPMTDVSSVRVER